MTSSVDPPDKGDFHLNSLTGELFEKNGQNWDRLEQYTVSDYAILDLSVAGIRLHDAMRDNLALTMPPRKGMSHEKVANTVARGTYRAIIDDLVRFLNLPSAVALAHVRDMSDFTFYLEVLGLFKVPEKDVFISTIRDWIMPVYELLRSQIEENASLHYDVIEIGLDYVVIRNSLVRYRRPLSKATQDEIDAAMIQEYEDRYYGEHGI